MENVDRNLYQYLRYLNINVSKSYFEKLILSHPDFPSLLSLSDGMQQLGIQHYVANVSSTELENIEYPYLVHVDSNGGELLLIKKSNDLINEQFSTKWTGIIIKAEYSEIKDESNNIQIIKDKNTKIIYVLLATILFGGSFSAVLFSKTETNILFYFISLVGLAIAVLLVSKDIGVKYERIEILCNSGSRANCDDVLNSRFATLFGVVKVSDIVLSYFSSCIISIVIASILPFLRVFIIQSILVWDLFSIPIIFLSLYYQKFIIKSWCRLCLLVSVTLIIQAVIMLTVSRGLPPIDLSSVKIFTFMNIMLLFLNLGFVMLKNLVSENYKLSKSEISSLRIKHNASSFVYALSSTNKVDLSVFENEMAIGNIEAPIQMLMVSNLFCAPCKEKYALVSKLISLYPNQFRVVFRFILSGADLGYSPTALEYIIMYWYQNVKDTLNESQKVNYLITEWFKIMDINEFMKKFPLANKNYSNESKSLAMAHYNWVDKNNITRTPTFFINNYIFPKNYNLDDIISMAPGIAEILNENSSSYQISENH